ncbi:hypothetical protein HK44_003600 [Pseudomonas fluorescens HK44]|uniref:Uncharacterized protein n=1 Tax=Pseudomonas fluorescens HK44 TaxID=1042209 RepID=A0A010RZ92_PSEFL|nr:hypothetical protein [Pseudomonas fluorescens]EXF94064.1 hypothetical protein HK44_003600 [Pseudomonas fluorescens HK44]
MSYDDLDVSHRLNTAVNATATLFAADPTTDAYSHAAYTVGLKVAPAGYAAAVTGAISVDPRITAAQNQNTGLAAPHWGTVTAWLAAGSTAYWVHFFSNNPPVAPAYRCYVCCNLAHTGNMLTALLGAYAGGRTLYFKVATHDEAQMRNDTIVSWHDTLQDAVLWANTASANLGWLNGRAPGGTFGGVLTDSVGIDAEVAGQTSTNKIAEKATAKVIRNNPYI